MFSCQNLTLVNHENPSRFLVTNLSFSMLPGAILYLIGSKKEDKSLILKCIAGLYKPFYGLITFQNKNLSSFENAPVDYIKNTAGIKPNLSVRENLSFWAEVWNTKDCIEAVVVYLGLKNSVDDLYHELSFALSRRLVIARLLLSKAPIWLLDDIESDLDHQSHIFLNNVINVKASSGGIIIITNMKKPSSNNYQAIDLEDYI